MKSKVPLLASSLMEQGVCVPMADSNNPAALVQLFEQVFPGDPQHVDLLCSAFRRFTPATLLFIPEKKLCAFLREMSPDFSTLQLKYDVDEDIRAVRAAFHGEKHCRCRCRLFPLFSSRSRPQT